MSDTKHVAVMTAEALAFLQPRDGGRYIDGTLGGGTQTSEILRLSAPSGRVLSFDVDPQALSRATERFATEGDRWRGVEKNFRHLAEIAREKKFAPVDGILLDLGFSSDQLEDPQIGLSFQTDGPLDMRFGPSVNDDGVTAEEIVNEWSPMDLEDLIQTYGEERFAKRIAEAISKARKVQPITTTLALAKMIQEAVPRTYEHGRIHPATRTFQALRMFVNDELASLKQALAGAEDVLAVGGRVVVITFHSLEDRIVKDWFRSSEILKPITKKPVEVSEEETRKNPRARSAKIRVGEKNKR